MGFGSAAPAAAHREHDPWGTRQPRRPQDRGSWRGRPRRPRGPLRDLRGPPPVTVVSVASVGSGVSAGGVVLGQRLTICEFPGSALTEDGAKSGTAARCRRDKRGCWEVMKLI